MSDIIYNEIKNVPYVYYLEWTSLNKKYIGCRYAKDCHPDDLFVTYFTSSKKVKELLDNGQYPDIIKILSTHNTADEVLEEEKRLLIENEVTKNNEFLNMAISGSSYNPSYIKEAQIKTWMENYNVDNPMKCDIVKNKQAETSIERYGHKTTFDDPIFLEKAKMEYREKSGYDNPFNNPEVRFKVEKTNIKRYGFKNPILNENVEKKRREICNELYGVDYPLQNESIHKKTQETLLKNSGYKYTWDDPKVKEKSEQTNIKKYGVVNAMQSKEVQEKLKESIRETYNVDFYPQSKEFKEKMKKNEKPCPFGCVSPSGKTTYNWGNLKLHIKSKHPEYYEKEYLN